MNKLAKLRAALDVIRDEMRTLHAEIGSAEPTDEQATAWEALEGRSTDATKALADFIESDAEARAENDEIEAREAEAAAEVRAEAEAKERRERVMEARRRFGGVRISPSTSGDSELRYVNPATASPTAMRSALLRAMEPHMEARSADECATFERTVRGLVRSCEGAAPALQYAARSWQQQLLVRASPEYARGFAKYISGNAMAITADEARAVAVGTNTQGGHLVPTYLDPTIIPTNTTYLDVVRQLCAGRGGIKQMLPGTGRKWNGIYSAGVTGSWDPELTEVSDDSPSFSTDGVEVHSAQAWAEVTFQARGDIAGIENDLFAMFAEERTRMEAVAHVSGTGSNQPYGIVTALKADTNYQIVTTTAAAIGVVDINKINNTIGRRWSSQGEWLMHPDFADAIQALGTSVGVAYTGSIAEGTPSRLKGKPWHTADEMPNTTTTTALDPIAILGDFGKYAIIDRPGSMSVQYVPVTFGSNGRPNGKSGWLMWWETGADVILFPALRLLVDKTSA